MVYVHRAELSNLRERFRSIPYNSVRVFVSETSDGISSEMLALDAKDVTRPELRRYYNTGFLWPVGEYVDGPVPYRTRNVSVMAETRELAHAWVGAARRAGFWLSKLPGIGISERTAQVSCSCTRWAFAMLDLEDDSCVGEALRSWIDPAKMLEAKLLPGAEREDAINDALEIGEWGMLLYDAVECSLDALRVIEDTLSRPRDSKPRPTKLRTTKKGKNPQKRPLTDREKEALELFYEHRDHVTVADRMRIKTQTAHTFIERACEKMGTPKPVATRTRRRALPRGKRFEALMTDQDDSRIDRPTTDPLALLIAQEQEIE